MNVENISLKKDAAPPNVGRIKVARYFVGVAMAWFLWDFAWEVPRILRGVQDTFPYEHVHSILKSLTGMFLGSFVWFNTAAQLSAKPKRLYLISFVLLAVFVVLTGIDFWLTAPTIFNF